VFPHKKYYTQTQISVYITSLKH